MWLRASALAIVAVWIGAGCSAPSDRLVIRTARDYSVTLQEATELARQPLASFASNGAVSPDEERNLIQAQVRYEALTEYQPTLFTLHFALGAVRHALGNTAEAEQAFRQALTLMPTTPTPDATKLIADTHHGLAAVLIDRGAYSEARAEAKIALEYTPDDANYLATLAAAEIQLKDLTNARLHLKRALALEPNHRKAKVLEKLLVQDARR
ncbi:MAG: hypothetical protein HONBIEJF_00062 [Fimbriimonadaceae bacterium]|nr:hypothetical protein [Fimbriimonadaceae bacterium]